MAVQLVTLEDMTNALGRLVGEPSADDSRWVNACRVAWINEGQLDFVEQTRCLEEDWTSAITAWVSAGDEIVALPSNCFDDGILNIYWMDSNSDYHELKEMHPRFDSIQNDDTGTPNKFYRVGSNIHLMPLPDADGTVVLLGQKMPDELEQDSDQTLIPAAYRKGPVQYAAHLAFLDDDEYAKADRIQALYLQTVRRGKKYAKGLRSKRGSKFVLPRII